MNQGIAICYVSDLLWLKFLNKLKNLRLQMYQQSCKSNTLNLKFIHKILDLAIGNDEQHDKIIKIRNEWLEKNGQEIQ
ncbi:unnamed protein product [Paramecium pentaurelia]|uniref:Uncharacterized protein n=1 Tax=Paramecium pentaurelia TaxID=43138 RepID=A0A8S1YFG9_9CILI|nr:unnamed protein product [Paramecium pentaurelia]